MHTESLAVIRTTKLDVAQWIASGMGKCPSQATSLCLARYAAAQLESAALIPARSRPGSAPRPASLLRRELKGSGQPNGNECAQILARVSMAMIKLLDGNSAKNSTISQLIRHEAAAAQQIRALCRG